MTKKHNDFTQHGAARTFQMISTLCNHHGNSSAYRSSKKNYLQSNFWKQHTAPEPWEESPCLGLWLSYPRS